MKASKIKETRGDRIIDVVNVCLLGAVLITALYPLLYVTSASLSDPMEVLNGNLVLLPRGFNTEAYREIFKSKSITTGYVNTIRYTFFGVLTNLCMTVACAYPLSQKDLYGRNVLTLVFAFTMFFNGGLVPTYLIVRSLGLINSMWALILPGSISMWNMIIMRTFFSNNIPYELHESAYIDGCSDIRMLTYIVLPLSAPILAVMVVFYGVSHWNSYFSALVYLTERQKYPLQLVLREILITDQAALASGDSQSVYDMMMMAEKMKYAVIVVASVPVLMLYPFAQRYFVKGVMIGAIKG